jgi:hypothetical protein
MGADGNVTRSRVMIHIDGLVTGALVGQAAREMAQGAGFGSERAGRLGVIVEELIRESRTREAVDGDESGQVELTFDGNTLRCVLIDRRLPLTHAEIDQAPVHRLAALRFVDRCEITFAPPAGNRAVLELRLENHTAVFLGLDADEEPDRDLEDLDDLEVRTMEPRDAELLVRCLYRCYGYTYPDSDLYLESHIVNLLASGLMRSTIALSSDGEIVGHQALVFEEEGQRVPEAGKLIVDPRFRSHRIPSRLSKHAPTAAFLADLPGYYGRCVTNHTHSQAISLRHGGVETGLMLGITPGTTAMTGGIAVVSGGRISLLPMVKIARSRGPARLSIPENLVDVVRTAADRLGLERSIDSTLVEPSGTTEQSFAIDHGLGLAAFEVRQIGADLVTAAGVRLAEVAQAHIDYVELVLDCEDPSAAWAIVALERLGFFFSSWLPEMTDRGDRILLQRLAEGAADLDGIQCIREEGEAIRDLVIAEWRRVNAALLRP